MVRVTFCTYDSPGSVGGPWTWIHHLLPALRLQGIDSRCLFLTWGDPDACPVLTALKKQGFDCPAFVCRGLTEERVRWLLNKLREDPPAVFVPNLVVPAFFAARWARAAGIATVGIIHSDDALHQGLQSEFVFGRPEFSVSALVCVSKELEQEVRSRKPRNTLVRRIPYGVPVPPAPVQRHPSKLRLAYVGRLVEEQKRITEVARAFCRVVREVPGTEAVLFGEGAARSSVEAILAGDGHRLPVRLAGRIDSDRIQEELLECDVIVLLSDYEGLPIALLEGMACGCVPVSLRIRSGIPELIEHGVTGLLVDDRKDAFVDAIRRLRNEPGLWERLSQAARARILSCYESSFCINQWAGFLQGLAVQSSSKRPLILPKRLRLPPVHPALAAEDPRGPFAVPLPLRLFRRSRMLAGRAKRRLLG